LKKQTPIIVVLSVAILIGALAWLLKHQFAQGPGITVVSRGPLDTRLWGIRPDAGNTIYDPNGKKIQDTLGVARWDQPSWGDKSHRFDFIFELPDTNEPPLFSRFPRVLVSGEDIPLGGFAGSLFFEHRGRRLLWLKTAFPLTFRKSILGGLMTRDFSVDAVDITLQYYQGLPGKAVCVFKGPFKLGQKLTDETGLYELVFDPNQNAGRTRFELNTKQHLDLDIPVLLHGAAGKRCFAESDGSSSSSPGGSHIEYSIVEPDPEHIAMITLGEKPFETTVTNVRLRLYHQRPRTHAGYLDEMAERLNVNLTPKELADRRFKSGDEAVEVVDIVRGTHILWASEAILHGGEDKKRLDPATLDPQRAQRLKQTVLEWTRAMDPEIRACGVRVGLYCKWAEFVEPAFELLEYPAAYDSHLTRDVRSTVAQVLLTYREQLSEQAIEHITRILLGRSDRDSLLSLRGCLMSPESQARINGYWRLAEDDRPWLWWDAVERLAQWGQFDGKQDSLPDKLKLRLVLLRGAAGFSNPRQIAPRAYGLLPELLRPELRLLDASTFYRVLERIAEKLDREHATEAVVNFLRCVEDYDYSGQAVVDKIVKYINLWHGLNIGELGADIDQQTSELQKYDWPAITAEAIKWYENKQDALGPEGDASDSNSGSP
jgi:hypothetical protein